MPSATQVHDYIAKHFSKQEIRQAIASIDLILGAAKHIEETHTANPVFTESKGEK